MKKTEFCIILFYLYKMFSRKFIELITLYHKLYMNAINLKNNYKLNNTTDIKFSLDKHKEEMLLRNIYSDFMDYYDLWYISYII